MNSHREKNITKSDVSDLVDSKIRVLAQLVGKVSDRQDYIEKSKWLEKTIVFWRTAAIMTWSMLALLILLGLYGSKFSGI